MVMKLKLKMQLNSDNSTFFEIVDCGLSRSQLGKIFEIYRLHAIEKDSVLLSLQFLESGRDSVSSFPRSRMKGNF